MGDPASDLADKIDRLNSRLDDVEKAAEALANIPQEVEDLRKLVTGLVTLMGEGFTRVQTSQDRLTSPRYVLQFAGAIVVPLLIALLGGYFVLKAGQAPNGR